MILKKCFIGCAALFTLIISLFLCEYELFSKDYYNNTLNTIIKNKVIMSQEYYDQVFETTENLPIYFVIDLSKSRFESVVDLNLLPFSF